MAAGTDRDTEDPGTGGGLAYRARSVQGINPADVDAFLKAFERERSRLRTRIRSANERAARARDEIARARGSAVELQSVLLGAAHRLATLEHEHRRTIEAIEQAAAGEIALLRDGRAAEVR